MRDYWRSRDELALYDTDLANAREAFVQRGLRAVAVMRCDQDGARPDPGESTAVWQHLIKPVAFEALVGAFRASSSYT